MSADLIPDNGEILQEEQAPAHLTPIPVVVEGPARVQELPTKQMIVTQVFLDSTGGFIQPQRVLGEDPRRKIARIVATDQKIRVGTSQKQVMGPDTCAIWPTNTVLEVTATSELWVAADQATTRCSIVSELWAG